MSIIEHALRALREGEPVVLDAHAQECRGLLVAAAEEASADTIACILEHSGGPVTVITTEDRLRGLRLPPGLPATVRLTGASSASSASAKAEVVRALADADTRPDELTMPGYVTPVGTEGCGVLRHASGAEAALDLLRAGGLRMAAVAVEVCNDRFTDLASGDELRDLAARRQLPYVTVDDVVDHRWAHEQVVHPCSAARIPTRFGDFRCQAWKSDSDGSIHLTFTMGAAIDPLVHVHTECPAGDIFKSTRCDCRRQLEDAFAAIATHGAGTLVYLRGGQGHGSLSRHLFPHESQSIADSDRITDQILNQLGISSRCSPSAA